MSGSPRTSARILALLPLLVWAGLVYKGSSGPAPGSLVALEIPDSLLHGAEYLVFGFLAARWVFVETRRRTVLAGVVLPALIAAAYGAADEWHQSFVPSRTPAVADFLADAVGGLLGAVAYRASGSLRARRALAGATAAGVVLAATASSAEPPPAALESLRPSEVAAHAEFLASRALGGRGTPSPECDAAARYVAERFRAAGLTLLGEDGFIPFVLRFRREAGESFVRRVGGETFRGEDLCVAPTCGDGEGSGPLVFMGYGLEVAGRDDYAGRDVAGCVVLLVDGLPEDLHARAREDAALGAAARPEEKARTAGARGAVAVLIARDPGAGVVDRLRLRDGRVLEGLVAPAPGGHRVTLRGHREALLAASEVERIALRDGTALRPAGNGPPVAMTVAEETRFVAEGEAAGPPEKDVVPLPEDDGRPWLLSGDAPRAPDVPALHVSERVAVALLGRPLAEALRAGPGPIGQVTVTARVRTEVLGHRAVNVAAVLPGADPAAPLALAVAHYDHLGTGPDGTVYPGADDNASGTAVLLAVAEALGGSPARPAGGVVFLAAGGEERGLLGSEAFVRSPPLPLARFTAVLNLDMVGRGAGDEAIVTVAPLDGPLLGILRRGEPASGLRIRYHVVSAPAGGLPAPGQRAGLDLPVPEGAGDYFARSDHFSFYRRGIPVAFVFGGMHDDHHRPSDTVDRLSAEKMAGVGRYALSALWNLADAGAGR